LLIKCIRSQILIPCELPLPPESGLQGTAANLAARGDVGKWGVGRGDAGGDDVGDAPARTLLGMVDADPKAALALIERMAG